MANDRLVLPVQERTKPLKSELNPMHGTISKVIGSGDNAKNSIVYKTIVWSFLCGVLFSLIIVGFGIYKTSSNPIDEIKGVWAIFVPVITLSLGYIFGKSE